MSCATRYGIQGSRFEEIPDATRSGHERHGIHSIRILCLECQ